MKVLARKAAMAVAILGLAARVSYAVDLSQEATFDIPPQRLASALLAFSQQAGVQVVVGSEVGNRTTSGISGKQSLSTALSRLLEGSRLRFTVVSDTAISVGTMRPEGRQSRNGGGEATGADGQTSPLRLAQAAGAGIPEAPPNVAGASPAGLQEVVVTAQKREERLQDVPVPVTAISADSLINSNQVRIEDYYATIPGLSVTLSVYGNPELIIRGISAGADLNPSVGVTVDDVPYGSTTALGGGSVVPDLDPSDLQRVEVLRGPQGTLYGANSLGGLFKYVTVDPSTEGFSGRVQADLSSVYNGNEPGYATRGAVNIPLSDTLAVRASGYVRRDAGYIDNIQTGQRAVNEGDSGGGRIAALWHLSDDVSLKVNALYQDSKRYGFPDADIGAGLGDLQQTELRNTGRFDRNYQMYSAVLKATIGSAELTAISGYSRNRLSDSVDYSIYPFTDTLAQQSFGVSSVAFTENNTTDKVSQEVRLSVPIGRSVDWLVGGFYTHERSTHFLDMVAADPDTGAAAGTGADYDYPTTYQEYALFTDVTVRFTSRFDVQIGGRESWNRQVYSEVDSGPFIPSLYGVTSTEFVFPEIDTRDNAFTYLVTPRYRFSEDLMAYLRIASGYRPGGPNAEATAFGLPDRYGPDKTQNYEVGLKGDALNHRLTFDASLYYINWKQIQLYVLDPANYYAFFANAGGAKSEGVELSSSVRPLEGLTLSGWVSWNKAVLTQSLPSTSAILGAYGLTGDRLPDTPRFSGSVSAEQRFPLGREMTGFVGATVSYLTYRQGPFEYGPPSTSPRPYLPAYAKADLRAGVLAGGWEVSLFGNNITDRRGALQNSGLLPNGTTRIDYIMPRMIGLSVSRTF